jgi:hypothetical protein
MLEVHAVADDEWDIVAVIEAPDDYSPAKQVNHVLLTHGAGSVEEQKTYRLVSFEDADAARESMPGYRTPGS